jgi:hypothetical protein
VSHISEQFDFGKINIQNCLKRSEVPCKIYMQQSLGEGHKDTRFYFFVSFPLIFLGINPTFLQSMWFTGEFHFLNGCVKKSVHVWATGSLYEIMEVWCGVILQNAVFLDRCEC